MLVSNDSFIPWSLSQLAAYFAAAIRGQSAIFTRATSVYLPFSGRKIETCPSFTSNQSSPNASMMLGLWVIRTVLVPASGDPGQDH